MKKKILIFSITIILCLSFLIAKEARAGSGDNVWGWAWAENIGWISFNCDQTRAGGVNNCNVSNTYGVKVNNDGWLTGYAWSSNIGWISFNDFDSGHAQAQLNLITNQVSGWARALANGGGWDGWIKLKGIAQDGSPYGVMLETATDEFYDWAWGSDVVGWISFNRSNIGAAPKDYKVMTDLNSAPTANTLSAPTIYGCGPSPTVKFNWTFDDPGYTQSAYEIQIDDDSNLDEAPLDTISGGADNFREYAGTFLKYNTKYWWRLMVWNSANKRSDDWIYPVPASFTTDPRWPRPDFTFCPPNPRINDTIQFCSVFQSGVCEQGVCSDMTSGNNLTTCPGAVCDTWAWNFGDGNSSDQQNSTHSYTTTTVPGGVQLTVTDILGHPCPKSYPIGVRMPLPIWKEIPPTF